MSPLESELLPSKTAVQELTGKAGKFTADDVKGKAGVGEVKYELTLTEIGQNTSLWIIPILPPFLPLSLSLSPTLEVSLSSFKRHTRRNGRT